MNKLSVSTCLLIALLIYALPVAAETPDGQTPAEETVCDPLREDGITKGLYGLCVAFCEAQDLADITVPLTPEALEALNIDAPSGRILENYNKKKQESDPGMPCILVQEPCPCFTKQELQSIDGYDADGMYMETFDYWTWSIGSYLISMMGERNSGATNDVIQAEVLTSAHSRSYCIYKNNQTTPPISRVLSTGDNGTLTQLEWDTCSELLQEEVYSR
jgi:hypothetical protein